jgi:DMSO/TMAO reductase YedYZ molybdopterin-dependent catalytic subunit
VIGAGPKPGGPISYARSLPRAKALQPEVLLAYGMNGEDLPFSHGFPLRAIVPGWYGMASVKWLTRIVVLDVPFQGYWQTVDYAYWERRNGLPVRTPLGEMQVKSEIARPARYEVVPAGTSYRVHGAAWTSAAEIIRVEVSTDAGATWSDARLFGPSAAYTWRFWEYCWHTPKQAGHHTLLSRATDSHGRSQPVSHDPDRANYMITHTLPVEVEVH